MHFSDDGRWYEKNISPYFLKNICQIDFFLQSQSLSSLNFYRFLQKFE